MGEFRHIFASDKKLGLYIDTWGAGPFVISAGKKSWRFEDSDRFGPALINRNGDLLGNPYPSERSPFWRAHGLWVWGGRRVEDDGVTCVWEEPPATILQVMPGRILKTIQAAPPTLPNWLEKTIFVNEHGVEITKGRRRSPKEG